MRQRDLTGLVLMGIGLGALYLLNGVLERLSELALGIIIGMFFAVVAFALLLWAALLPLVRLLIVSRKADMVEFSEALRAPARSTLPLNGTLEVGEELELR